ncbi:hypothetical protein K457DRAFT_124447 [Linnemannia elongata AG-77]|uniref:Uncharacterized protein n=1 Tax=Linnemannia elongata AG-77 TaxID=1314771 RepID=A0A197K304_9FUNG|nr:hypothetical protein K457DRAFT_124447 [Linnemannia elongata AG-77]
MKTKRQVRPPAIRCLVYGNAMDTVNLVENKIGVGACSKAVLSGKNQYIPVQSIDILANWHAISIHSDDFEASRSKVCNQCVIIRAVDTDRKILVASAGDCLNCEEN